MKALFRLIGWNALLLIVGAAILEAAFGSWFGRDPLPGLNVFRNVEWVLPVDHLYPSPDPVLYRRDRWGLRGNFGAPSSVDLLVIGGSTADERFIAEGRTWPDIMSQCLAAAGLPQGVANAGVTGQSSRGHALNYDLWFSKISGLAPKFTLVYVGINEIWADSPEALIRNDVRLFNEQANSAGRWAVQFHRFKMKSALYRLYRTIKGQWVAAQAGITYSLGGERQPGGREVDRFTRSWVSGEMPIGGAQHSKLDAKIKASYQKTLSGYRINLGRLIDKIQAAGSQPVLMTQLWASYRREGPVVKGTAYDYVRQEAFNRVTREMCQSRNIPCLDLARNVTFQPGDTFDVIHTTPTGSRQIGDFACRQMVPIIHRFKGSP
jgi:hypothetical protein